jgi:hypothetical protein
VGGEPRKMSTKLLRWCIAVVLLPPAVNAWGQANPYGLWLGKYNPDTGNVNQQQTTSRLYVIAPTNNSTPILRLVVADKPFLTGTLDWIRCWTNTYRAFVCEVSLGKNRFPTTDYAQLIDIPLNSRERKRFLESIIDPTTPARSIEVYGKENNQSRSYTLSPAAVTQLRKEYNQAQAAQGIE